MYMIDDTPIPAMIKDEDLNKLLKERDEQMNENTTIEPTLQDLLQSPHLRSYEKASLLRGYIMERKDLPLMDLPRQTYAFANFDYDLPGTRFAPKLEQNRIVTFIGNLRFYKIEISYSVFYDEIEYIKEATMNEINNEISKTMGK